MGQGVSLPDLQSPVMAKEHASTGRVQWIEPRERAIGESV